MPYTLLLSHPDLKTQRHLWLVMSHYHRHSFVLLYACTQRTLVRRTQPFFSSYARLRLAGKSSKLPRLRRHLTYHPKHVCSRKWHPHYRHSVVLLYACKHCKLVRRTRHRAAIRQVPFPWTDVFWALGQVPAQPWQLAALTGKSKPRVRWKKNLADILIPSCGNNRLNNFYLPKQWNSH